MRINDLAHPSRAAQAEYASLRGAARVFRRFLPYSVCGVGFPPFVSDLATAAEMSTPSRHGASPIYRSRRGPGARPRALSHAGRSKRGARSTAAIDGAGLI